MENLYYRDKKFSIEIRDLTRCLDSFLFDFLSNSLSKGSIIYL